MQFNCYQILFKQQIPKLEPSLHIYIQPNSASPKNKQIIKHQLQLITIQMNSLHLIPPYLKNQLLDYHQISQSSITENFLSLKILPDHHQQFNIQLQQTLCNTIKNLISRENMQSLQSLLITLFNIKFKKNSIKFMTIFIYVQDCLQCVDFKNFVKIVYSLVQGLNFVHKSHYIEIQYSQQQIYKLLKIVNTSIKTLSCNKNSITIFNNSKTYIFDSQNCHEFTKLQNEQNAKINDLKGRLQCLLVNFLKFGHVSGLKNQNNAQRQKQMHKIMKKMYFSSSEYQLYFGKDRKTDMQNKNNTNDIQQQYQQLYISYWRLCRQLACNPQNTTINQSQSESNIAFLSNNDAEDVNKNVSIIQLSRKYQYQQCSIFKSEKAVAQIIKYFKQNPINRSTILTPSTSPQITQITSLTASAQPLQNPTQKTKNTQNLNANSINNNLSISCLANYTQINTQPIPYNFIKHANSQQFRNILLLRIIIYFKWFKEFVREEKSQCQQMIQEDMLMAREREKEKEINKLQNFRFTNNMHNRQIEANSNTYPNKIIKANPQPSINDTYISNLNTTNQQSLEQLTHLLKSPNIPQQQQHKHKIINDRYCHLEKAQKSVDTILLIIQSYLKENVNNFGQIQKMIKIFQQNQLQWREFKDKKRVFLSVKMLYGQKKDSKPIGSNGKNNDNTTTVSIQQRDKIGNDNKQQNITDCKNKNKSQIELAYEQHQHYVSKATADLSIKPQKFENFLSYSHPKAQIHSGTIQSPILFNITKNKKINPSFLQYYKTALHYYQSYNQNESKQCYFDNDTQYLALQWKAMRALARQNISGIDITSKQLQLDYKNITKPQQNDKTAIDLQISKIINLPTIANQISASTPTININKNENDKNTHKLLVKQKQFKGQGAQTQNSGNCLDGYSFWDESGSSRSFRSSSSIDDNNDKKQRIKSCGERQTKMFYWNQIHYSSHKLIDFFKINSQYFNSIPRKRVKMCGVQQTDAQGE